MEQKDFLFHLDERPPIHKNLIYGLQWVMIAIPNVLVFSTLCAAALRLDHAAQISFSQWLLIVTGLMTLLQSLKGHRYPVLEGPSTALLLTFIILAPYGLSVIEGGMILGGLLPFIFPLLTGVNKNHPYGDLSVGGYSLLIILFVSLLSHWLHGFLQTASMLIGIIFGLILFLLKGEISWTAVVESSWLALPSPFWGVWPTFSLAPFCLSYLPT